LVVIFNRRDFGGSRRDAKESVEHALLLGIVQTSAGATQSKQPKHALDKYGRRGGGGELKIKRGHGKGGEMTRERWIKKEPPTEVLCAVIVARKRALGLKAANIFMEPNEINLKDDRTKQGCLMITYAATGLRGFSFSSKSSS
jgi:hypothetical protein